jgi:hypothetical protein
MLAAGRKSIGWKPKRGKYGTRIPLNLGGNDSFPVSDMLPNFGKCTNSGKVGKREEIVAANG